MRRKKHMLAVMLCAFSMAINSIAVVAQDKGKKQEPKSGAGQPAEGATFTLPAPPNRLAFIQSDFSFGGPVVKGAPYSAEAVTETIQTLGDGNRIIQSSSSKIYRDGEGRTRREQELKAIGPWAVSGEPPVMISIDDPVTSVHYNLDSNTKTAHKMTLPLALSDVALEKARNVKEMRLKAANGAEVGASGAGVAGFATVTAGPSHTIVSQSSDTTMVNAPSLTRVRSNGAIMGAAVGPIPGPNGIFSWYGEGVVNTEQLGNQVIEGVLAEGQRLTVTIEAGKIGNERPIVTVNERWYSPELQTVILSKNSDPRMGETTYKLINIDRSEPDSSLFQVPADYTVEEGPGFGIRPMSVPPEPPTMRMRKRPNEN
jgi:hypothetical protein